MERPAPPVSTCGPGGPAGREAKKESLSMHTDSSLVSSSLHSRPAVVSTVSTHSQPAVAASIGSSHKDSSPEKESVQLLTSTPHQPVITAPVMGGEVPDRLRMLSLISLDEKPDARLGVESPQDPPSSPNPPSVDEDGG